jgi:hypothetical protein
MARAPDGTSQVPSSIPGGSEYHAGLKKSPRLSSFPKQRLRLRLGPAAGNGAMQRPSSHGLCEKTFLLITVPQGRSFPRLAEFFKDIKIHAVCRMRHSRYRDKFIQLIAGKIIFKGL